MSDIQNAFRLIGSLDLTSLSHDDTEEKIAALCAKAVTPYGTTAAVCVYPEWVPLARKPLKKTPKLPPWSIFPPAATISS